MPAKAGTNRRLAGALAKAMHTRVVLTKTTKCWIGKSRVHCWKVWPKLAKAKHISVTSKPSSTALRVITLRLTF